MHLNCVFEPPDFRCPRCDRVGHPGLRQNCGNRPHKPIPKGCGLILKQLFDSLSVAQSRNCGCDEMMARMNMLGWKGCIIHRDELRAEIIKNYKQLGLLERATVKTFAGVSAIAHGLYISPLDPIGSILDEALRLCEEQYK